MKRFRSFEVICRSGEIGRHATLRGSGHTPVRVRVSPSAPFLHFCLATVDSLDAKTLLNSLQVLTIKTIIQLLVDAGEQSGSSAGS